ncbi:MAG: relaxase/mobilization nuclease domain-containing protein, partial [Hyphomonadaceae bacterium]
MIIKASQRSGGKQLGLHLLKTEENEHVEIHEVSGFLSQNLMGAMSEAYAMARGTKCQKYLFSVSLSPPQNESVQVEVFEKAISDIEDRLGLKGQPRAVIFHEKEGRRHCHVVWSRID